MSNRAKRPRWTALSQQRLLRCWTPCRRKKNQWTENYWSYCNCASLKYFLGVFYWIHTTYSYINPLYRLPLKGKAWSGPSDKIGISAIMLKFILVSLNIQTFLCFTIELEIGFCDITFWQLLDQILWSPLAAPVNKMTTLWKDMLLHIHCMLVHLVLSIKTRS